MDFFDMVFSAILVAVKIIRLCFKAQRLSEFKFAYNFADTLFYRERMLLPLRRYPYAGISYNPNTHPDIQNKIPPDKDIAYAAPQLYTRVL